LGQAPAIMDFDTEAKAAGPIDLTDASVVQQELTFRSALRPVLEAKCVSCHSGATPAGELTLEARYSDTANYPAGRWAQEPHVLSGQLNAVPVANRVPGYNWSVARIAFLERDQQRQAFIPTSDPYKPQGELAPWDPAYQTLMLSDTSSADRFYFLSDHPYATQVGRGGRWSNTSYLLEVLTGRDLAMKTYTGMDHTSMLDQAEIRMLMAIIDNGMPFMARCSDTTVPTGPNAGKPWGDPVARGLP
jgi:hypothetical protein